MTNTQPPLTVGFDNPRPVLSGNVEQDLRMHKIPVERENVGAATGESMMEVNAIHERMIRGQIHSEDLSFLFRMNQALLLEGMQLRERVDQLKHEIVKSMYEKRKL